MFYLNWEFVMHHCNYFDMYLNLIARSQIKTRTFEKKKTKMGMRNYHEDVGFLHCFNRNENQSELGHPVLSAICQVLVVVAENVLTVNLSNL